MAKKKFEDLQSEREKALSKEMDLTLPQDKPVPGYRIRDIRPQDPAKDTFDQRFRGTPYPAERPGEADPGYQERFLDPTKVISGTQGVTAMAGGPKSDTPGFFPPGVKFDEPPPAQPGMFPPGVKFDEPVPPTPVGPTDDPAAAAEAAREAATRRMQRAVRPPGGKEEGTATALIEAPGKAIYNVGEGVGRVTKEATTGEGIPILEKEGLPGRVAAEAAQFTPMGTATGIMRGSRPVIEAADAARVAARQAAARAEHEAALARMTPEQRAQIETGVMSIPRAAESGTVGQALARLPFTGVREAAAKATGELQAAGTAAAARPTGEVVTQDVAGGIIRKGIEDARAASERAAAPPPPKSFFHTPAEPVAAAKEVPARIAALTQRSNEDIVGEVIRMAGSKAGADVSTLVQLRKYVPAEQYGEIQSAVIQRLGQGRTTGEFNPATFVSAYGNIPDRSKNFLFGEGGLRTHLDAIESVSRRAPTWQRYERAASPLGTRVGVAASTIGLILDPMRALSVVIPPIAFGKYLAKPATAAPIAQWVRSYERVARTDAAPAAMASFKLATTNLSNSLGIPIALEAVMPGAAPPAP